MGKCDAPRSQRKQPRGRRVFPRNLASSRVFEQRPDQRPKKVLRWPRKNRKDDALHPLGIWDAKQTARGGPALRQRLLERTPVRRILQTSGHYFPGGEGVGGLRGRPRLLTDGCHTRMELRWSCSTKINKENKYIFFFPLAPEYYVSGSRRELLDLTPLGAASSPHALDHWPSSAAGRAAPGSHW